MQPTNATYRLNNRPVRIRVAPLTVKPRVIEVQIDNGTWTKNYTLDDDRTDADFQRAVEVAVYVYGRSPRTGGVACSNSTVHEIWNAMREVAGC